MKASDEPPISENGISRFRDVRVAVLGASGFIGSCVGSSLGRLGARLTLFVRNARTAERVLRKYGVEGELIEIDLAGDPGDIETAIRAASPAIIFNLAGYGVDPSERDETTAYRINSDLVGTICRAIETVEIEDWPFQRIVHVGSALEYGEIGGNLSEVGEAHPTTLYGRTKLAGTLAIRQHGLTSGLKALTARLFTVYGPGEHPGRLLPGLLSAATSAAPIPLTEGLQKRDFTFVEDVAEGLLRLAVAGVPPGEIINLATGKLTSVREFIGLAANLLAIDSDRLRFGSIPTRWKEMEHDPVTTERLQQFTNWLPSTSLKKGIAKTMKTGLYY